MPFRFHLQPILHLRQSIEHQQELRLHAANQQVARVRQLILRLDDRIQESRREFSRELESGTRGGVIRFGLEMDSILGARRRELELELLRATRIRDQQQRAFQSARQDREKIETLCQHASRDYRIHKDRSDQRILDELFLLQQAFRKRR